jgi:hypothetical protein
MVNGKRRSKMTDDRMKVLWSRGVEMMEGKYA